MYTHYNIIYIRALENMYLYNVYTRFSFIMPVGHRTRRTFTTFTKLKDSFFFFFLDYGFSFLFNFREEKYIKTIFNRLKNKNHYLTPNAKKVF